MKFYAGLMNALGLCAAVLVAVLTLLVTYDVIARNLGLGSLSWVLEISEYMLPTLISLTAPWLMFRNQHVKLDMLPALLPTRALHRLERGSAAIGMVAAAVFAWYAGMLLLDSKEAGTLVMKSLIFPEWWLYIATPVGFALLALECARRVFLPGTVSPYEAHGGAM